MATRSKSDTFLLLAAIAAGAFVVYKLVNKAGTAVVKTATDAYNASRGAVADTLYDWFGPTENFGPGTYLTVTFVLPGAPKHAIGADQIAPDGTFTYSGQRYKLANNEQGQHFAVPMT